uniref:Uncharacterized protein n=1 Tax=Oryza barthii TaxID=65489 RepID=A0A0D3HMC2_9ORYZ
MAPTRKGKKIEIPINKETDAVFPMGHHGDVMVCLSRNYRRLIVYKKLIHGTVLHYAAINCGDFTLQYCAAQLVQRLDDAEHMYGLLNRCQHPNILKPTDFWPWEHFDALKKHNKAEAFITYPLIDGSLLDVPMEDLFLIEKFIENDKPKCRAYGFTDEGSKDICDILSAVSYINDQLPTTINSGSTSSKYENESQGTSFPLSPLRIYNGQIYYNKMAEGQYQILFGNFYTELPNHMRDKNSRGRKAPTVDVIKRLNWEAAATFLDELLHKNMLEPNDEMKHLKDKLKKNPPANYSDLLWEPGLWTTYVKIHFLREIFWCIESDEVTRKLVLRKMDPLGIDSCMVKLGYSAGKEKSLLHSIKFLRKRVVAHQDTTYLNYKGDKNDVGECKRLVELLVQKSKADYMIELVSHIRQLGWVMESPILRSKVFKAASIS